MAGGLHIKVSFKTASEMVSSIGAEVVTKYYAVSDEVQPKLWSLEKKLTAAELDQWLQKNGGKLDRSDGPAVIRHYEDTAGEHYRESWYIDGQRHREGAPAVIDVCNDGQQYEAWFTHDWPGQSDTRTHLQVPGVTLVLPKPPV